MLKLVVQVIHILVRIFILATPFLGDEYLLSLHAITIPFVMLHWITNQTVCALTELEKALSGKKENDTFFGQIFVPIYKNESFVGTILKPFYEVKDKDEEKRLVWFGLTCLWFITLYRLSQTDFSFLRAEVQRALDQFTLRPHTPPRTAPLPAHP
jgi:hypothetical protein